ncbi:hypothetical protein Nepgr_011569 [Nepenthes gracilis]|uniref:Uncharacterized protein n=1 Tax=Nepenthes gracilis TaxID=150966 RepID=A0AAD3SEL1_NEPGR|nr:hypothetical protein Nepgr_011569 [Nepenthes gracilis]
MHSNQAFTEIKVDFQWKPFRCGKCNRVGHSKTHCKPVKSYRPSRKFMKDSHPRTTKGRGNSNGQVTMSPGKVDPDPVKLPLCKPMGDSGIDNDGFPSSHADGPRSGTHMWLASSDQEGNELDPYAANGCRNATHLSADADSQHYLPSGPMHASALVEDASWALVVELQCFKKDGADFVSQRGSLDGVQVEEVVEDDDDFYDPTLNALKMLLEANATQTYLDSLTPEGRMVFRLAEKAGMVFPEWFGRF